MSRIGIFDRPGLFLTYGLGRGDWTPETIVDRAAAAGFGWVARALQDDCFADPELVVRLRHECRELGLNYVSWMSEPIDVDRFLADNANAYLFNVEQPDDWINARLGKVRIAHPALPLGVVTNFAGLDAKAWKRHRVFCLPEAYTGDAADATVRAQTARAVHEFKWNVNSVFPVVGCYHGYPFSAYVEGLRGLAGRRGYSVYAAETLTPADWSAIAAYNAAGVS